MCCILSPHFFCCIPWCFLSPFCWCLIDFLGCCLNTTRNIPPLLVLGPFTWNVSAYYFCMLQCLVNFNDIFKLWILMSLCSCFIFLCLSYLFYIIILCFIAALLTTITPTITHHGSNTVSFMKIKLYYFSSPLCPKGLEHGQADCRLSVFGV